MGVFELMNQHGYGGVHFRRDQASGLEAIIAVHDSRLGPALGGARMWRYGDPDEAVADVLRLAGGMTLKAAAAGLDLGGGKGVICAPPGDPPTGEERGRILEDFADTVNVLDGRYVTAEDVGTSAEDMATLADATRHVSGLSTDRGGSGDPSPFTALGVEQAMRACARHAVANDDLSERSVAVVGLGHVGGALATRLANAGAKLTVADIDPRRKQLADQLGAEWLEPSAALRAKVDVLAPCALGGVLDQTTIPHLNAKIVCGAANNQLAHDGLAEDLAARGILYAPDFVANAGGIVNISVELAPNGYDATAAEQEVSTIGDTVKALLEGADANETTPLAEAYALAARRLADAKQG
jgi:leucine dehydrogenase